MIETIKVRKISNDLEIPRDYIFQKFGLDTSSNYLSVFTKLIDTMNNKDQVSNNEMLEVLKENRELHNQLKINQNSPGKILISPKELHSIFGISIESQKQLRRRITHPIPFVQIEKGGNVKYKVSKLLKWLENYEKNN